MVLITNSCPVLELVVIVENDLWFFDVKLLSGVKVNPETNSNFSFNILL